MNIVNAENISFYYSNSSVKDSITKNSPTNAVFTDLSFSVKEGDFVLLCGPSGCGKTTLLRLLKSEITPNGILNGTLNINIPSRKIGYVFQNPDNQPVCATPYEEIAFGMANNGFHTSEIKKTVCELSALFNISDKLHQNINTLSGGEKQLINIAAIMAMKPDLLLLDEPDSMLDPVGSENLMHMIKRLNKDYGTTIIMCQHNLENCFALSDKILFLGTPAFEVAPSEAVSEFALNRREMLPMLPAAVLSSIFVENNHDFSKPADDVNKSSFNTGNHHKAGHDNSIIIKNAAFGYENTDVLKDINFTAKNGCCTVIAGGNGSGKSTLLKLIDGCLKPDYGKIKVYGKAVYLPQIPTALFIKDTLLEDYRYYLNAIGKNEAYIEKLMERYPLFSPLKELFNMHPYDLSGGQMGIGAIFKICLGDPDILLLDEPTKSMDTEAAALFAQLVKDLCSHGKTVIIVTHDMEFASLCADTICLLFDGEIVVKENTREFITNNMFYTTAAAKATKNTINALNRREIIAYGKSDSL